MKKIYTFLLTIILSLSSCSTTDVYDRFVGKDLHLISSSKELFWFSGIHNSDPNHRMFDDIEKQFIAFSPTCVLVEGGANKPSKSKTDAILNGGESRYVAYLAYKNSIPVYDIEPPIYTQINYLKQKYEIDEILSMYLIRQLYQKQREFNDNNVSIDINEYLLTFLSNKSFAASDAFTKDYVNRLLFPYLNKELNNDNWVSFDYGSIIYFNKKPNVINQIWKETISFRDDYCVQYIAELSKQYTKLFIMMGADHIKTQENRLRKIYSE